MYPFEKMNITSELLMLLDGHHETGGSSQPLMTEKRV